MRGVASGIAPEGILNCDLDHRCTRRRLIDVVDSSSEEVQIKICPAGPFSAAGIVELAKAGEADADRLCSLALIGIFGCCRWSTVRRSWSVCWQARPPVSFSTSTPMRTARAADVACPARKRVRRCHALRNALTDSQFAFVHGGKDRSRRNISRRVSLPGARFSLVCRMMCPD